MFLGNVFLVMRTSRNLHKGRQLLHFNSLLALVRVAEMHSAGRRPQTLHRSRPRCSKMAEEPLPPSFPARLVTPCVPRSGFTAVSACPERPRGAAEWPAPPLTPELLSPFITLLSILDGAVT